MPGPIPVGVRQAIFRRAEKGRSVAEIGVQCQVSERTVRHLLKQYRDRGPEASRPRYRQGPRTTSPRHEALRKRVVSLREEHPTWGADLLRVLLQDGNPKQSIPSARTIRRWLQGAGCQPAPAGRRPEPNRQRASRPHEVWQIDASEEIALQQRMNKFDRLQRERYPIRGNQSRLEVYPELNTPHRRYTQRRERRMWNWELVTEHLSQYAVIRKVDKKGAVSIYNRQRYVSVAYAGRPVVVTFDPVEHDWEFHDVDGHLLRRQPAPELSAERIYMLNVLKHHKARPLKSWQN